MVHKLNFSAGFSKLFVYVHNYTGIHGDIEYTFYHKNSYMTVRGWKTIAYLVNIMLFHQNSDFCTELTINRKEGSVL